MNIRQFALPLAAAVAVLAAPAAAQAACAGAGVITRIQGLPSDVTITRGGAPVAKPRVLEVICTGDTITVRGNSVVTLSVDGVGAVRVDKAKPYSVGPRRGRPGAAGNVYRAVSEQVMPDMKRLPWDVRTKGEVFEPLHFLVPTSGVQSVAASRNQLAVRLVGPGGPYKVELKDASGAVVKSMTSAEPEFVLGGLALTPGGYTLAVSASDGEVATMKLRAEASVPGPSAEAAEPTDPELVAAFHAVELAKSDPNRWSFEAQQILATAPENGLDRERVYALIETYGDF